MVLCPPLVVPSYLGRGLGSHRFLRVNVVLTQLQPVEGHAWRPWVQSQHQRQWWVSLLLCSWTWRVVSLTTAANSWPDAVFFCAMAISSEQSFHHSRVSIAWSSGMGCLQSHKGPMLPKVRIWLLHSIVLLPWVAYIKLVFPPEAFICRCLPDKQRNKAESAFCPTPSREELHISLP